MPPVVWKTIFTKPKCFVFCTVTAVADERLLPKRSITTAKCQNERSRRENGLSGWELESVWFIHVHLSCVERHCQGQVYRASNGRIWVNITEFAAEEICLEVLNKPKKTLRTVSQPRFKPGTSGITVINLPAGPPWLIKGTESFMCACDGRKYVAFHGLLQKNQSVLIGV